MFAISKRKTWRHHALYGAAPLLSELTGMVRVKNLVTLTFLDEFFQLLLSLQQWQPSQVFVIEPEQIECIEKRLV